MNATDNEAWFFEIYTRNPANLEECGWDIKVGFVHHSSDYTSAKAKIERKFGRLFDCIITLHRCNPHPLGYDMTYIR